MNMSDIRLISPENMKPLTPSNGLQTILKVKIIELVRTIKITSQYTGCMY